MKKKMSRILVISLSALGDVAMTLPVIYSLARQNPGVKIDVMTRPSFARMFVGAPANVRLLTPDFDGEHRGPLGMLRLAMKLRRCGYSAVADLHKVSRSLVVDTVMRMAGVPVAVMDSGRRQRKAVLGDKTAMQPFAVRCAGVFRRIGLDVKPDFKSVFECADSVTAPVDVPELAIGIAPFARCKSMTLPPETMRNVVRRLAERGWSVFLFGGKADAAVLEEWASEDEQCVSLAGKYGLDAELAIMARLNLMVSMDSAYQHLASAAGTRVLSVWGSTTPLCGHLGYGQSVDNTVCRNLPCQPCSIGGLRGDCPRRLACLNQIDVNDVLLKIERMR